MKKLILPLTLLFLASGCFDSNDPGFDNTADLEFLEENAGKEGVIVTDSGLQYRNLSDNNEEENGENEENGGEEENGEEDNGEEEEPRQPGPTDSVTVHYQGELVDGTVFDSSIDRGEPETFALNRVIAGFSEGIQLMKVGQTFELVIPSNLAYGNNPPGPPLYPGATIIFEVQLLEIED